MYQQNSSQNSQRDIKWRSVKRRNYLFTILLFAAFLIGLLAVAVLVIIVAASILNLPLADYLPGINNLPPLRQIYAIVAALLFIALILLTLARWRLMGNESYQFVNGCPSCHRHDLIRVHRQQYQRLAASLLRIPLRNYACRNCQWQGALLFVTDKIPASQLAEQTADSGEVAEATEENVISDVSAEAREVKHPAPTISPEISEEETVHDNAPEYQAQTYPTLEPETHEQSADGMPEESGMILAGSPEDQIGSENELVEVNAGTIEGEMRPVPNIRFVEDNVESPTPDDTIIAADEEETRIDSQPAAEGTEQATYGDADMTHMDAEPEDEPERRTLVDPQVIQKSEGSKAEAVRAIVVAPFGLSMRSEPDRDAPLVLTLQPDTIVEIVETDSPEPTASWRQVKFEGQTGWASAAFLRYLQS